MIYKNVLSDKQQKLIKNIKFLPEGSYMAGGTALALQLGHRTSFDFDFYTDKSFETEKVLDKLQSNFNKVKAERIAKDTLILDIDKVSLSLFYYPYRLIDSLIDFEGIKLASVKDIAAMKMVAISMRGKRRDFIDVYWLLKKFGLEEILEFTLKKYPSYQPMVILKGLIYFKDAEDEDLSRGIKIFEKDFSWEGTKEKISEEVKKYQMSMIKK